jgi:hypothetical protein
MNLPRDITGFGALVTRHTLEHQELRRRQSGVLRQLLGVHINGAGNLPKRHKQIMILAHGQMQ